MADLNVDLIPAIQGALRSAIDAHGPIDKQWIASAAKRINGAVRQALKEPTDEELVAAGREFIAEFEREAGPIPDEVVADIQHKWASLEAKS